MFTAASKFYKAAGDSKAAKKMDEALEKYDKQVEDRINDIGSADDDFFF